MMREDFVEQSVQKTNDSIYVFVCAQQNNKRKKTNRSKDINNNLSPVQNCLLKAYSPPHRMCGTKASKEKTDHDAAKQHLQRARTGWKLSATEDEREARVLCAAVCVDSPNNSIILYL